MKAVNEKSNELISTKMEIDMLVIGKMEGGMDTAITPTRMESGKVVRLPFEYIVYIYKGLKRRVPLHAAVNYVMLPGEPVEDLNGSLSVLNLLATYQS